MPQHSATAVWNGGLKTGKGHLTTQTGALDGPYTHRSRFTEDDRSATNPEELIGAALSGCFSMFLSGELENAGYSATRIRTEAKVTLTKTSGGTVIERIRLTTEAEVPGMSEDDFQKHVQYSKENCPVSKALKAVPEITVEARLQQA